MSDVEFQLKGYPNPRQRAFFESRARHIAYGGARGGGKSWAMRRKFVLLALRYPNLQLLLLRRTLSELTENHVRMLQTELSGLIKTATSAALKKAKPTTARESTPTGKRR